MVPGGEGQEPWVPIAKAQLKKQTKMFQAEKRKRESQAKAAVDKDKIHESQRAGSFRIDFFMEWQIYEPL